MKSNLSVHLDYLNHLLVNRKKECTLIDEDYSISLYCEGGLAYLTFTTFTDDFKAIQRNYEGNLQKLFTNRTAYLVHYKESFDFLYPYRVTTKSFISDFLKKAATRYGYDFE